MHTVHISGHAVSSSTLNRQLGRAALSARSAGRGSASVSLFGIVVVGGDVCAPPVSVPVMAVQVRGPSAVWMERTALAPSPTAEATRFSEVSRTSPAANTVGMLVSNGSGGRPSAVQVAPSSSGSVAGAFRDLREVSICHRGDRAWRVPRVSRRCH